MGYKTICKKSDGPASMIFISHGGGPWPLINDSRHTNLIEFLKEIPAKLISPSAILVISGHWEENIPTVQSGASPSMYYDYNGFPEETYQISYPSPGSPELAQRIAFLLESNGISSDLDPDRGYDHGVFVPLLLMYPEAKIPCLQISLKNNLSPEDHIKLGKALTELRNENILIVGSGASFHNLQGFRQPPIEETVAYNVGFEKWLLETMTNSELSEEKREQQLINWEQAPGARYCHPREEHLLPLHVCYGIAGSPADEVVEVEYMDRLASMYIWSSTRG
jgi:4,5-DOPA dioxygenase extradiol